MVSRSTFISNVALASAAVSQQSCSALRLTLRATDISTIAAPNRPKPSPLHEKPGAAARLTRPRPRSPSVDGAPASPKKARVVKSGPGSTAALRGKENRAPKSARLQQKRGEQKRIKQEEDPELVASQRERTLLGKRGQDDRLVPRKGRTTVSRLDDKEFHAPNEFGDQARVRNLGQVFNREKILWTEGYDNSAATKADKQRIRTSMGVAFQETAANVGPASLDRQRIWAVDPALRLKAVHSGSAFNQWSHEDVMAGNFIGESNGKKLLSVYRDLGYKTQWLVESTRDYLLAKDEFLALLAKENERPFTAGSLKTIYERIYASLHDAESAQSEEEKLKVIPSLVNHFISRRTRVSFKVLLHRLVELRARQWDDLRERLGYLGTLLAAKTEQSVWQSGELQALVEAFGADVLSSERRTELLEVILLMQQHDVAEERDTCVRQGSRQVREGEFLLPKAKLVGARSSRGRPVVREGLQDPVSEGLLGNNDRFAQGAALARSSRDKVFELLNPSSGRETEGSRSGREMNIQEQVSTLAQVLGDKFRGNPAYYMLAEGATATKEKLNNVTQILSSHPVRLVADSAVASANRFNGMLAEHLLHWLNGVSAMRHSYQAVVAPATKKSQAMPDKLSYQEVVAHLESRDVAETEVHQFLMTLAKAQDAGLDARELIHDVFRSAREFEGNRRAQQEQLLQQATAPPPAQ